MTTATVTAPVQPKQIESIEFINDMVVMVVCCDEKAAKAVLKRNPRAIVQRGHSDDERVALLYNIHETNLINAVRRA